MNKIPLYRIKIHPSRTEPPPKLTVEDRDKIWLLTEQMEVSAKAYDIQGERLRASRLRRDAREIRDKFRRMIFHESKS